MDPNKKRRKNASTDRRTFLKTGILAGVASTTVLARVDEVLQPVPSAPQDSHKGELDELGIADLQDGMQSGKYSAAELTRRYTERLAAIDKKGPGLNSVIELNPDAMQLAEQLDRERKQKGPRGPLHGIPVLIKDNIDTADRMQTTAGSLALVGSKPQRDAFIVTRLRDAGAVILGKTNLSEWANFRSTHSTSGWSGRGGQTRNPYATDRNPCGSSSGSGVAVSANLCTVAVGTETDGSIVCPSSANGIVGLKPTLGLVSRSGIVPISHSQDTAGPMTRSVRDAAIMLGILAGVDRRDAATASSSGKAMSDYTRFLDANGLKGARIGVARKFFGFNDRVDRLMNDAVEVLKKQGAVIIDPADIPTTGKFDDSELDVLLFEFKADLNSYLASLGPGAPVKSLKEIIEFNEKEKAREMPFFGQELMVRAEAKGPLTDRAYRTALAKNLLMSRKQGIDAVMDRFKLDALVGPTGGPPWATDLINGDHFSGGCSTPPAVAGYPNINVPAGHIFGLPVGISFFGRAYSEPTLIRIAYAFEQATKHRRTPRFLGTPDLTA